MQKRNKIRTVASAANMVTINTAIVLFVFIAFALARQMIGALATKLFNMVLTG